MLFVTVLTKEKPKPDDVWAVIGQSPDLNKEFLAFMTPPAPDCNINVYVRSTGDYTEQQLRPYTFCVRMTRDTREFEYPDLTIVVVHNLTKEQREPEQTKQVLKFQQPQIESLLVDNFGDLPYSEMTEAITSTGNGLIILRDVEIELLKKAFHDGNRNHFSLVEGPQS